MNPLLSVTESYRKKHRRDPLKDSFIGDLGFHGGNAMKGLAAGALGAPVDLMTMFLRPLGYRAEPYGGSEQIGKALGADTDRASFIAGLFGAPDTTDIGKLAVLTPAMKKLMKDKDFNELPGNPAVARVDEDELPEKARENVKRLSVEFKPSRYGGETVMVDVEKLDKSFRKDPLYTTDKIELDLTRPVEAPHIELGPNGVGFTDGRHRFQALKEMGFKKIPVTVPKDQVQAVKKALSEVSDIRNKVKEKGDLSVDEAGELFGPATDEAIEYMDPNQWSAKRLLNEVEVEEKALNWLENSPEKVRRALILDEGDIENGALESIVGNRKVTERIAESINNDPIPDVSTIKEDAKDLRSIFEVKSDALLIRQSLPTKRLWKFLDEFVEKYF